MSGGMAGKVWPAPDAHPQNWAQNHQKWGFRNRTVSPMLHVHMLVRFAHSHGLMPSSTPIRVLLCDDVQAFRALVRYSLEDEEGIEVVGEAADGNEGVRQAADLQPDVILLDLSMPECDGLEAIPAMAEQAPHAQIVAFSGFTADRMAEPVMARGAIAYLEKGVRLSEVAATIRDVAAA
jgi:CheY-like chemotaxis protein